MIENLLKIFHNFPMLMSTSLPVEEILLPKYVNRSAHVIGSQFREEMVPSYIAQSAGGVKYINCISCNEFPGYDTK